MGKLFTSSWNSESRQAGGGGGAGGKGARSYEADFSQWRQVTKPNMSLLSL